MKEKNKLYLKYILVFLFLFLFINMHTFAGSHLDDGKVSKKELEEWGSSIKYASNYKGGYYKVSCTYTSGGKDMVHTYKTYKYVVTKRECKLFCVNPLD